jgi:hypothetical protein
MAGSIAAFVLQPGEGQLIRPAGGPTTIEARTETTNGSVILPEVKSGPRKGPPAHVHRREDEMWHVLDTLFVSHPL